MALGKRHRHGLWLTLLSGPVVLNSVQNKNSCGTFQQWSRRSGYDWNDVRK